MTLRRGKSAATTLLVLCCLAAIAVAGVAAQFEDAPAANATTADANATAASVPDESDETAPDTIDSAPAPEASEDSSGGGARKAVTGAKTTAQVATTTAMNTANAVATGGDANATNTTAPGPGFEGLTEPLPEGYGCYNITNLQCNCTKGECALVLVLPSSASPPTDPPIDRVTVFASSRRHHPGVLRRPRRGVHLDGPVRVRLRPGRPELQRSLHQLLALERPRWPSQPGRARCWRPDPGLCPGLQGRGTQEARLLGRHGRRRRRRRRGVG